MASVPSVSGPAAASSRCTAQPDESLVVIACGALGSHIREITARREWHIKLNCLPAVLHNHPRQIVPSVERIAIAALARGQRVAVAYADCGTYGALDELCARLGLRRLPGLHCFDLFAGEGRLRTIFASESGTYLLTDFSVRTFQRTIIAELGLDRHPQLLQDYFRHYRRIVWLTQARGKELELEAERVAAMLKLPLTVLETGTAKLERELERLVLEHDSCSPPAWQSE